MSENIETANQLYATVKNLNHDLKTSDAAKAKLIIEYANDAIAAYGKTNQEKKVELTELVTRIQEIVPPKTFSDLKTIVQSKLLKIIYPKNARIRNFLFILVALVIVVPGVLALKSIFPTAFSSRVITNQLETLPSQELEKLEPEGGKGGDVWVIAGREGIEYTVYNGSDYQLKEITVRIVFRGRNSPMFTSELRLPLESKSSGEPFKNSTFSREHAFSVGWEGKVEGQGVISARGVRVQ